MSVRAISITAIAVVIAGALIASAQVPSQSPLMDSSTRSIAGGAAVQFLYPEQVTLPAGKSGAVALHFKIASDFHINSHFPHDSFLIPTEISIPTASGVRLENVSYPAGEDITLPSDPSTKLNVYSGEFTIQTRLVAERGNHLVQAKLRYQACNRNACMPPKSITVPVDVIGQ